MEGKVGQLLERHLLALDEAKGGFCGSALVVRKDVVLLHKSYGQADADKKTPIRTDALWDWASVTKQFTAAAVLKLAMAGKLSIEDSVRKYYPAAPADKQPVTLRHLLTHTSGIKQGFDPGALRVDFRVRDATVLAYLRLPMVTKPGEKFAYSNLAYGTLAAVVEKVSGESFEVFSTKNLFRPAGMKDACLIGMPGLDLGRVPRDGRGAGVPFAYGTRLTWGYRGAGGAVATLAEMFLWDRALRGETILNKAMKALLYRTARDDYALGWYVHQGPGDDVQYSHSGSVGKTVTYYLRILKEDVVIALAYSYRPEVHPQRTTSALLQIARQTPPPRVSGNKILMATKSGSTTLGLAEARALARKQGKLLAVLFLHPAKRKRNELMSAYLIGAPMERARGLFVWIRRPLKAKKKFTTEARQLRARRSPTLVVVDPFAGGEKYRVLKSYTKPSRSLGKKLEKLAKKAAKKRGK